MSLKSETVDTYNNSARSLAKKFDEIGPRKNDIDFVFSFCKKENPFVLEIGCGNGRDAAEICKHTNNYLGIDISEKLIEIASQNLPDKQFVTGDIETITIPLGVDIVFAFASLIHVQKDSIEEIMKKLSTTMEEGGLIFISCKYSHHYEQVTKEDEFGVRTYWHYSENDVLNFTNDFVVLDMKIQMIRNQKWIDVLYRKK